MEIPLNPPLPKGDLLKRDVGQRKLDDLKGSFIQEYRRQRGRRLKSSRFEQTGYFFLRAPVKKDR
jgi:hypothetical protein